MSYPVGAIQSVEDMKALVEDTIIYQASKKFQSLSEYRVLGGYDIVFDSSFGSYWTHNLLSIDNPNHTLSRYSLRDANIPLNRYNDWFFFYNKKDAENYIGKTNKVDWLSINADISGRR